MALSTWLSRKFFGLVHSNNLVYNTCWEDPRLDRVALKLTPDDTIVMITSAGCNALDYALCEPKRICAVDMNPRQNALLELKQAGIRTLEFDDFFQLFGRGKHDQVQTLYKSKLRPALGDAARQFWDRKINCFKGGRWLRTFYFHGTSGMFARMINFYVDRVAKVRDKVNLMFAAKSVEEQAEIYRTHLKEVFWTRFIRWVVSRDGTLSLVGVPRSQRIQVERDYQGGIAQFIEDSVEAVFTKLSLHDNYFWRVYLTGEYTPDCCPEYLKPDNFQKLKQGLVDRVVTHTGSILDYLRSDTTPVSRFILLDHMDWLSANNLAVLQQEWQAILDRAAPNARILFRSGGLKVDYVDPLTVNFKNRSVRVGDVLKYDYDLANELHPKDRVHTYGSFYIADVQG